jgi:hypothetical protein
MSEHELPMPPIQEWADLRQAIEWIAYGLTPIPAFYDITIRGKARNIDTSTKSEIKDAKKILLIALYEEKISALGNIAHTTTGYEDNFSVITKNLWEIGELTWNDSCLSAQGHISYINIRLSSEDLFKIFLFPTLKKVTAIKKTVQDAHSFQSIKPEYITPYLQLMELAIIEHKITEQNQPPIKKLTSWFLKRLPDIAGERYASENKAKMLASFVRLPHSQKGGIIKHSRLKL